MLQFIRSLLLVFVLSNSEYGYNCVGLPVPETESLSPLEISGNGLSDPIVSCDSSIAVIPFTRTGNLILIKAKADTIEGTLF